MAAIAGIERTESVGNDCLVYGADRNVGGVGPEL